MLKNLTFIAAACLLATTGCTLTIGGGTDSDTSNNTTEAGTGSTSAGTSGSTSGGTEGGTTASTSPTTTSPTTGASTSTTTAASTSEASTGGSTGGSAYGNCGWFMDGGYYACSPDGDPGVVDPNGTYPIDCPDPLPEVGSKCDDMGPITGQGCCLPDGSNYYCDNNGAIAMEACGA